MLKCFTILKAGLLSPWWTLPLNSTWCVCSAPQAHKAAELIGFTSRQCVRFHQLQPRCISTPSHHGALRCRCIRHLCLPDAGAQHSNSAQSRYAGQKDGHRNRIKHLVNFQKNKNKSVLSVWHQQNILMGEARPWLHRSQAFQSRVDTLLTKRMKRGLSRRCKAAKWLMTTHILFLRTTIER